MLLLLVFRCEFVELDLLRIGFDDEDEVLRFRPGFCPLLVLFFFRDPVSFSTALLLVTSEPSSPVAGMNTSSSAVGMILPAIKYKI